MNIFLKQTSDERVIMFFFSELVIKDLCFFLITKNLSTRI